MLPALAALACGAHLGAITYAQLFTYPDSNQNRVMYSTAAQSL